MSTPEEEALSDLLRAVGEVSEGIGEALEALGQLPATIEEMQAWAVPQRIASRAFLKGIEQLQDLLARVIRLILVLEDEYVSGLSARGLADKAESLGVIGSSDAWSAVVKLRNQLVHEYPISKAAQLARFRSAWDANTQMLATQAVMVGFLRDHGYSND